MRFEFATASRILFGPGVVAEVPPLAAAMGGRAFMVTGRDSQRAAPLIGELRTAGIEVLSFAVAGEPTVEVVSQGVELARGRECDLVIGFGGGSAIDAAKAISILMTNGGAVLDYLEVIGGGKPLTARSVPCIAIPTTAGTGAEVTRNAVLAASDKSSSPQGREVKVSLRSPLMLPALAVVDSELTHSAPPAVTASTGLDALTQVVEPFVSLKRNPVTDAICREGMACVARSLRRAYEDGSDAVAREEMSLASLCGGLALANAGLGAVHGFAGPVGGMFPVPHGTVCARLLPIVMETNVRAMRQRGPAEVLDRYDEIARILTGRPSATANDGVAWVAELCADLAIPPLSRFGITVEDFPELVARSRKASSMKGNPLELTEKELTGILVRAVGVSA